MLEKIECSAQFKAEMSATNERYSRNEKDDVYAAIDYLYSFLEKIKQLHPSAEHIALTILRNKY
jgi:hypothetical protein